MEKRSEWFFLTFVNRPIPFTYIPPTRNERGRKPIAMYVIAGHSRRWLQAAPIDIRWRTQVSLCVPMWAWTLLSNVYTGVLPFLHAYQVLHYCFKERLSALCFASNWHKRNGWHPANASPFGVGQRKHSNAQRHHQSCLCPKSKPEENHPICWGTVPENKEGNSYTTFRSKASSCREVYFEFPTCSLPYPVTKPWGETLYELSFLFFGTCKYNVIILTSCCHGYSFRQHAHQKVICKPQIKLS